MKPILVALALAAVAVPADAISRYNSKTLSCDEAQARVAEEGAVILRWTSARKPGLPLYDRYVANRSYCQVTEGLYYDYIPTADTNACVVTTCKEILYDD